MGATGVAAEVRSALCCGGRHRRATLPRALAARQKVGAMPTIGIVTAGPPACMQGQEPCKPKRSWSNVAPTEPLVFDAIRTPRGKGKVERVAAHGQAGRPGRRPDARDARPQRRRSIPTGSTTSCSAASRRSATRAPTSPRPRRSRRACRTRSPACSSTASAPRGSRRSTSPRRRSPPAGRTWCFAGGVESMSRVPMGSDGGAWAMDPETNYDTSFVPQGISADLIATIEELQPRGRRRVRGALAGARRGRAGRRGASRTR